MNRTPRSSIVGRCTPWLLAAAFFIFGKAVAQAGEESIPWRTSPHYIALSKQEIPINVHVWDYLQNAGGIKAAAWEKMTFQNQYKSIIAARKPSEAAVTQGIALHKKMADALQRNKSSTVKAWVRFRDLNKTYQEAEPAVKDQVAIMGRDPIYDFAGYYAMPLPGLLSELNSSRTLAMSKLNEEERAKFKALTLKQAETKRTEKAKVAAASAAEAKSGEAAADAAGRTFGEGGRKANGRGRQTASAAALGATGMAAGSTALKGGAEVGVAEGKVAAIAPKKEEKGFFASVGDFLKKIPLPVWTALAGGLVGLAIGGGKGLLIGAGVGAVAGIGIGMLKDASAPKTEYEKKIQDNNGALHDIDKRQKSLAEETVGWHHDLDRVNKDKAATELALNGGADDKGKPVRGIKQEEEDLLGKLGRREISRDQYNTQMDGVDKRKNTLGERMDGLDRQEAALQVKRPVMAQNIEENAKLEKQREGLQQQNNGLGEKLTDFNEANKLKAAATAKVDEANRLRGGADQDRASAEKARSFEERAKFLREAKLKDVNAAKAEVEAKQDKVKSDEIFAKNDPENEGPKIDPVAVKKQKDEMKRMAVVTSPKYDYQKDPQLAKRYKDCDEQSGGAECAMGKAAANLQGRAAPGSKDEEAGKKLAWCAEQLKVGANEVDGCGTAMLRYREGAPKLAANVPKARGLASLFTSPTVYYQDAAGEVHSQQQYEVRRGSTKTGGKGIESDSESVREKVWECRDHKAYFRGKEVGGANCSESN